MQSMHQRRMPQILVAAGMFDINATPLQLVQLGSALLLESHASRVTGMEALLKRSLDVAIALPVLIASLPLLMVMATGCVIFRTGMFSWRRVTLRYGESVAIAGFLSEAAPGSSPQTDYLNCGGSW